MKGNRFRRSDRKEKELRLCGRKKEKDAGRGSTKAKKNLKKN